jgi:hypothetical protein
MNQYFSLSFFSLSSRLATVGDYSIGVFENSDLAWQRASSQPVGVSGATEQYDSSKEKAD